MTRTITLPIKCSTVKRINTFAENLTIAEIFLIGFVDLCYIYSIWNSVCTWWGSWLSAGSFNVIEAFNVPVAQAHYLPYPPIAPMGYVLGIMTAIFVPAAFLIGSVALEKLWEQLPAIECIKDDESDIK